MIWHKRDSDLLWEACDACCFAGKYQPAWELRQCENHHKQGKDIKSLACFEPGSSFRLVGAQKLKDFPHSDPALGFDCSWAMVLHKTNPQHLVDCLVCFWGHFQT